MTNLTNYVIESDIRCVMSLDNSTHTVTELTEAIQLLDELLVEEVLEVNVTNITNITKE